MNKIIYKREDQNTKVLRKQLVNEHTNCGTYPSQCRQPPSELNLSLHKHQAKL